MRLRGLGGQVYRAVRVLQPKYPYKLFAGRFIGLYVGYSLLALYLDNVLPDAMVAHSANIPSRLIDAQVDRGPSRGPSRSRSESRSESRSKSRGHALAGQH